MDKRWLLDRMAQRNETIASLARAVGRDRAVVHRILDGDQPLQLWMTPILADKLGVSETELLSHSGELSLPPLSGAPLIPWHSVGTFSMTNTRIELSGKYERVMVPIESETLIAIKIADKSMEGIFPVGSTIVVDYSEKDVRDQEIGVFANADRCVVRRYRMQRRKPYLAAEGLDGITEEEFSGEVVGRVVAAPFISRYA